MYNLNKQVKGDEEKYFSNDKDKNFHKISASVTYLIVHLMQSLKKHQTTDFSLGIYNNILTKALS